MRDDAFGALKKGLAPVAVLAALVALALIMPPGARLFFGLVPVATVLWGLAALVMHTVKLSTFRWTQRATSDETRAMRAIKATYWMLMTKLTLIWIAACLLAAYCAYGMQRGMGREWFPFTRSESIGKQHPLYDYASLDMPLLVFGFLAITGVIWLPMYFLFEGIEASKKINNLREGLGNA